MYDIYFPEDHKGKLIAKWERQEYGVSDHSVNLSLFVSGKVQRVGVPARFTEQAQNRISQPCIGASCQCSRESD